MSKVKKTTDQELMLAVKQGEVGRLGALFDRHHDRIYRFCLRLTGDPAASEDLVQDIFMRVLKYRRTYRGDRDFLPWLYRLARNATHDHFRRGARRRETGEEIPDRPSDEPTPWEGLEAREDARRMRRALLELPVARREVLVLSRFEERRYDEIAGLLGCSVGAVKVRVHRALKQLRSIYLELGVGDGDGDGYGNGLGRGLNSEATT